MSRVQRLIAALLLGALIVNSPVNGVLAATQADEYRLKAAFLLNFARFAQWPKTEDAARESELIVGVLGRDPFGETLRQLAENVVNGRTVRIVSLEEGFDPLKCQLVFISGSEAPRLQEGLRRFVGHPVLLVSDIPRFGSRGGHIELFTRHNKVRFRINLARLRAAGIVLSSKLLRLAELVGEDH